MLENASYVATSTSTVDGKVMKSSTESDGKGTMKTSVAQDINQYRESAQYIGTETCPAGTCQVWRANGPGGEVSYYIDSQNRISKIRMGEGGTETTYEYKDVSIVIPAV